MHLVAIMMYFLLESPRQSTRGKIILTSPNDSDRDVVRSVTGTMYCGAPSESFEDAGWRSAWWKPGVTMQLSMSFSRKCMQKAKSSKLWRIIPVKPPAACGIRNFQHEGDSDWFATRAVCN